MVSSNPPEYLFRLKQQVEWNKDVVEAYKKDTGLDVREGIRDESGEHVIDGPFTITKIDAITSRCTCADPPKKSTDQHTDDCGAHDRKRNGHRQRIYIKEWNCGISGKFLRPA
jgi:hypothetical protein